jgi:predicted AAA+ superfamily ATPase
VVCPAGLGFQRSRSSQSYAAKAGSQREELRKTPKFFLFDSGVKRALDGSIDFGLQHGSFEYGILFEQFVLVEILRRISYLELSEEESFLATEGGAEIDVVLARAGRVVALIEIKSGSKVDSNDVRHIKALAADFKRAKSYCLYGGDTRYLDGDLRSSESAEVLGWLFLRKVCWHPTGSHLGLGHVDFFS